MIDPVVCSVVALEPRDNQLAAANAVGISAYGLDIVLSERTQEQSIREDQRAKTLRRLVAQCDQDEIASVCRCRYSCDFETNLKGGNHELYF